MFNLQITFSYLLICDRASPLGNQPAQSFPVLFFGNSTLGKICTPELFHSTGKYFLFCNMHCKGLGAFLRSDFDPYLADTTHRNQQQTFPQLQTHYAETQRTDLFFLPFLANFYSEISSSTHKELRLFLLNMSFLWACRILLE